MQFLFYLLFFRELLCATLHTWFLDIRFQKWPVTREIEATVQNIEKRSDGSRRITIGSLHSVDRKTTRLPVRARIRVAAKKFDAEPGNRLRMTVRFSAPPGPVMPGGYDFARCFLSGWN